MATLLTEIQATTFRLCSRCQKDLQENGQLPKVLHGLAMSHGMTFQKSVFIHRELSMQACALRFYREFFFSPESARLFSRFFGCASAVWHLAIRSGLRR